MFDLCVLPLSLTERLFSLFFVGKRLFFCARAFFLFYLLLLMLWLLEMPKHYKIKTKTFNCNKSCVFETFFFSSSKEN